MILKMKLASSIAAFVLVLGLMLIGVFAAKQGTVNMGGSISFTATDVYARVTGNVAKDTSKPANLDVTYSSSGTQGDDTVWNNLNLAFDSVGTPIVITITVENLSSSNTLRVNLNDTVTSGVENFKKEVTVEGQPYTNLSDITLQTNGSADDSTTFTITLSVEDKNNTIVADFNYQINLFDQNYVPKVYENFEFTLNEQDKTASLIKYTGNETEVVIPSGISKGQAQELSNFTVEDFYSVNQNIMDTLLFGTWNYTDNNGEKGTLTALDVMGGSFDPSTIATPIKVEVDYKVVLSDMSDMNMQWFSNYMSIFDELQASGNIIGGFYAKTGSLERTYFTSSNDFNQYLMGNFPDEESSSQAFPIILELENPINSGLTYIEGKDYIVTSIGDSAFSSCSSLTSIEIPTSVTSIGTYAFSDCRSLTNIIVDKNNPNYSSDSYGVLYNKDKTVLIQYPIGNTRPSFIIPSSVTSIGSGAISWCSNLTSIEIPSSVASIGNRAFYNCRNLTEINFNAIAMNDLSSNNYVFYDAGKGGEGITVNIGVEVTKIPTYLFYPYSSTSYSPKITKVIFEKESQCETIGSYAFNNCSSLTSIEIPSSVTSIGTYAFSSCRNLTEINFNAIAMNDLSSNNYVFSYAGRDEEGITVNIGAEVTIIPKYLFCPYYSNDSYSPKITKVIFEEGGQCQSIGKYAFYACRNLTEINFNAIAMNDLPSYNYVFYDAGKSGEGITVNIGAEVTKIPAYLFYPSSSSYSPKITKVIFEEGSKCQTIGTYAFYYCNSLTTIEIPSSMTSIGGYAFYYCRNLTEINFNAIAMNDLSSNNYVFYDAGKDGEGITVNIGVEVTKIPAYLFNSDSINFSPKITKVIFEEGGQCQSIGKYAFYACRNLTEINFNAIAMNDLSYSNNVFYYAGRDEEGITVNIGAEVTRIPAFLFCPSYTNSHKITKVIFEEGSQCQSIGTYAFGYCEWLTSIEIPSSVTSIGGNAFSECSSLTSIEIPSSVTSIGDRAFYNCSSLTEINYNARNVTDIPDPKGSNDVSVFGNVGKDGEGAVVNIGKNVERIPANLFRPYSKEDYPNIKVIYFEEGSVCKDIGSSAFRYCSSLTNIEIPSSLTSIGDATFEGCDKLQYNKHNGVRYLGNSENPYVVLVDDNDFNGGDYIVQQGCKVIAYSAFRSCSSLTSIVIPSSVTSIGTSAFRSCSSLTSIVIPSSVTSIGGSAFYSCRNLTSVTFGENSQLESILGSTFQYCSSLTNIEIPSSVTSIGSYAFEECSSLSSVTFEDNSQLGSIGDLAFRYCSSLKSMTINATTPPKLGKSVFMNAPLTNIYVPSASVSAYKSASGWSTYSSKISAIV